MGKVRLLFLISVLVMLELSSGEKIIQPYGFGKWASYSSKHSNKNTPGTARLLGSEATTNENIQKNKEKQQQGRDEESSEQEMIVSPGFIGALSHIHDESQEGYTQNQGFDKLITQTYYDLNGYQVHSDVYGSTISEVETSNELEKLINQVSPPTDNQRIPDITQLRNISIEQLPIALP